MGKRTVVLTRIESVVLTFDEDALPAGTKPDWLEYWAQYGNMGKPMIDLIAITAPDQMVRTAEKWTVDRIDGLPVDRIKPGYSKRA